MRNWLSATALACLLASCATAETAPRAPSAEEVDLAAIERERLRAFVDGDWDTLYALHSDDFELVNPRGQTWTKSQYLDPQREGSFRYLVFEPVGEVRASVVGDAGAVRYESDLSVRVGDNVLSTARHRHTDYYERRDGRWQVVFSQATAVE
ncbi:nuclear transport factor 2 family protein [Aurantiacibacter hainanensis]|uniref:nuclear transport factor 2 family protein n=1 Tax=Aurantiacibacter hainanensis TaxID=3076114 RepID=UPI0030C6A067